MKCRNCQTELIETNHIEYDGGDGSTETHYECVNGCAYPTCEDEELTSEELKQRNKVDTMTEYGVVKI